jgi:hypothetical protein
MRGGLRLAEGALAWATTRREDHRTMSDQSTLLFGTAET